MLGKLRHALENRQLYMKPPLTVPQTDLPSKHAVGYGGVMGCFASRCCKQADGFAAAWDSQQCTKLTHR